MILRLPSLLFSPTTHISLLFSQLPTSPLSAKKTQKNPHPAPPVSPFTKRLHTLRLPSLPFLSSATTHRSHLLHFTPSLIFLCNRPTTPLLLHTMAPVPHCSPSPSQNTLRSLTSRPHQLYKRSPLVPFHFQGSKIRAPPHETLRDIMDDSETVEKASWSKETLHIFCDICIKAIDMGMRPNSHFDRCGWKYIVTSFREQTGQPLVKAQLKNKWDVSKKDWRLWTKLIGETGVGWSNELGTIVASDEWWKSRIQENRGAKKFRQSGIEPSLKFKFDRMFSGVTATGQHAWAPSSGTLPDTEVDLDTLNVGLEGADLEEGSGDSEENVDINFENNNSRGVGGEHISSSSNTKSSGKRKEREHPEPRGRKKKSSGIGAQLVSIQQQLLDSMSS